jgi:hypothetical protein
MVLIFYPFTQIFIIGHKGKTNFPEQKFCFRVHFFFQLQKCSIATIETKEVAPIAGYSIRAASLFFKNSTVFYT